MSATTLPTLPPVGGYITQQVLASLPVDDVGTKFRTHSFKQRKFSPQGFSPTASGGKIVEKIDTASYRNSFFHNLCLRMLETGYHQAFSELFNLVNKEKRSTECEDHLGGSKLPIDQDEEKLNMMKEKLIAAEIARRQGRTEQVYEAQVALAKYFDSMKDFRLAEQIYHVAFKTSRQIRGDGRKKEAEANCNLARTAERMKDFMAAKQLYEEFHSLTYNKDFKQADGTLLHNLACESLQRVYIILSNMLPVDNEEKVMHYLHQAYDIAKEGGNENEVGKVGYLIGNKYDQYGKQELAVKYHNEFLEICKTTKDDIGMGKACQALAFANQRQGNMEAAMNNLKMFLQVAERSGDLDSRREACRDLGALYNSMGKYVQSASYLKRAFDLSHQNESETVHQDSSSCEYAVALAHGLFTGCVENVSQSDRTNLQSLLNWKSERVQIFSSDKRTYGMFEPQRNNSIKSNDDKIKQMSKDNSRSGSSVSGNDNSS